MSDASNPSSPTRRSARVHHEVMVGVSSEAGTFSGWGTNLSVGGVFANSHHAPPIHTRVQLLLQLPGPTECKRVGRVARAHPSGPGAAGVAAKQELPADARERIGGFARNSYELAAIVPGPKQFRSRRRARLHRTSGGGWGFAHPGSTAVEPVDECLLFEGLLQELADAARGAGELAGVSDLGLLAGETKGAIDLRVKAPVTPGLRRRAEKLLDHHLVRGVTLHGEILGDPVIADPALPNGARLRARPDTFAQANRVMVPSLVAEAAQALGGARHVLELFCGSGTLTLPLLGDARRITTVENAGPSLALLRRSADDAALAVKLVAGDAADVVHAFDGPLDAVLLDPPRIGAAAAVRALGSLGAPRVVYVSCDAPTLARDGRILAQAGYRLDPAPPPRPIPPTAPFQGPPALTPRPILPPP